MNRVCFLIPDLSLGGAQKQCFLLAKAFLSSSTTKILVVTMRDNGEMSHLLSTSKVEVVNLGTKSGFDLRAIIRLRRILKAHKIRILVTWLHSADVIGCIATRGLPIFWVLNERDSAYEKKFRYLVRYVCGIFASMITANSSKGLAYWKKVYFWKSIHLVHNIIEAPKVSSSSERPIDIVYGGRFSDQKNILKVANLLNAFVEINPESRVALRGEGEHFDAVGRILEMGISRGNISLSGYESNFRETLSQSKTVISLSLHEGSPNVVLEALMEGTIPILSRIPEHIAIVGTEYPYLVGSEINSEQILSKMKHAVLSTDRVRQDYGRDYLQSCTVSSVVSDYEQVFSKARL